MNNKSIYVLFIDPQNTTNLLNAKSRAGRINCVFCKRFSVKRVMKTDKVLEILTLLDFAWITYYFSMKSRK